MSMIGPPRKRKEPESTNFFPLDKLCDEFLTEILIKLPIKTVHRCKCVSKHWYSLISNPYFSKQYIHSRPKYSPPRLTLGEEDLFNHSGFLFQFIPPTITFVSACVVASCNGLVLCGKTAIHLDISCLCNPLTKEFVEIPPPQWTGLSLIALACDNDASTYNVVCVVADSGFQNQLEVEIFSFDLMRWSKVRVNCPRKFSFLDIRRGISCNGVIYWLVSGGDVVIVYDLYNEVDRFRFIDLPKPLYSGYVWMTEVIGTCQGCLRYSRLMLEKGLFYDGASFLEVWELKEGEWRLAYNMCLRDPAMDGDTIDMIFLEVTAIDAVDPDVVYGFASGSRSLVRYNVKNKRCESILENTGLTRYSLIFSSFVLPCWPTPVPTPNQNLILEDVVENE